MNARWAVHARAVLLLAVALACASCGRAAVSASSRSGAASAREEPGSSAQWWKGNTHTHTLWSDGDDFPEMVADWYRRGGYHFLSITDHNTLAESERWLLLAPTPRGAMHAYRRYRERFGPEWVEERRSGDSLWVRLKRPSDYRARLEQNGGFLLIAGEEVTQYLAGKGAHMNVLNVAEVVPPQPGATLLEMFRRDLQLVRSQEQRTGREIAAVLNHPNFLWSQTAEDLLELPELRFFELYNGHPHVNTQGDTLHAGVERIWDIVLTGRASRGEPLLYGVATDDAHDYHEFSPERRNPGRGWIVVRAPVLRADTLMAAMKRGAFYASTGVELADVRHDAGRLSITIRGAPGVTYTTQFVGTRAGYDTASTAVYDTTGAPLTRRYSRDVGAVLAEVTGLSASYDFRGDELYVRARVVASREKSNPLFPGEVEMAWTQPVTP